MLFARILLATAALVYLTLGIFFLAAPELAATSLCYWLGGPTAFTEFRAFYGGGEIGLAAFLAACAVVRRFVPAGLLALLLLSGGTAVGRLVGMAFDGSRSALVIVPLAGELTAVVLTAITLWRLSPRHAKSSTD